MKQKKFFFLNERSKMADSKKLKKIANSQNLFVKISWIGSWVSRIDWCQGHWCSCEAFQRKGKNSLKIQKMHFYPFFELISDRLMTIYVEQHHCPSHQFILLTQGPIHEIFTKKFWELAILKNGYFEDTRMFLINMLNFLFFSRTKKFPILRLLGPTPLI